MSAHLDQAKAVTPSAQGCAVHRPNERTEQRVLTSAVKMRETLEGPLD